MWTSNSPRKYTGSKLSLPGKYTKLQNVTYFFGFCNLEMKRRLIWIARNLGGCKDHLEFFDISIRFKLKKVPKPRLCFFKSQPSNWFADFTVKYTNFSYLHCHIPYKNIQYLWFIFSENSFQKMSSLWVSKYSGRVCGWRSRAGEEGCRRR